MVAEVEVVVVVDLEQEVVVVPKLLGVEAVHPKEGL